MTSTLYTKLVRRGRWRWHGEVTAKGYNDASPFDCPTRGLRRGGHYAFTLRRLHRKLDRLIDADRRAFQPASIAGRVLVVER